MTRKKQTEQALSQSELQFRQLADAMPQIVWTAEPDGKIHYANRTLAEYTGLPTLEVSSQNWVKILHPDDLGYTLEAWNEAVRTGKPYIVEYRIIRAVDRTYRWHAVQAQPIRDEAGKIIKWYGSATDIHDSKLAHEEVTRLAKRLGTTLESITDAFFTVNREWRFTYINREAEGLFERTRTDLLGKVIWEELKEAVGSIFHREYLRAVRNNCAVTIEDYSVLLKCWLEVRAYPSEEGLAVYFRDVTDRKSAETSLRVSEERLRLILGNALDAHIAIDVNGRIIQWNRQAEVIFGWPAEKAIGLSLDETIIPPAFREAHLRDMQYMAEHGGEVNEATGRRLETIALRRSGEEFPVELSIVPIALENQLIFSASIRDITKRKQADERIRDQASLLDKAQDAIIVRGLDHRVLFWNKSAERLYGWTEREALGRSIEELHFSDNAFFDRAYRKLLQAGEWAGEMTQKRKDGTPLIAECHWTLVSGDDGQPKSILAINTDITRRKADEREIYRLAFHDTLTGLPNRQLLMDRLDHALALSARNRRMGALMLIDLDNFKTLNDTLGHDQGDLLLQQVARRLSNCVRESDTVARLGGDEFVILLEALSEDDNNAAMQSEAIGEKILSAFKQPYQMTSYEHHCTPSLGVILFNGQVISADELLKQADLAMYQAKAAGRNAMCFFDPAMQARIIARAALEADLHQGLRDKEFILHYQPQIDSNGSVFGAEALVRWQRGQRMVSPAEFIPLAEETGLIEQLGRWVLETACAQLVAWTALPETAELSMAVNVSARQLHHPDFVSHVLAILDETGANPLRLKLELTESLLVNDVEETISKMMALKSKGVSFSLDDFGTGYSSLAYLKRLPLDQLKIDQSFIRDMLVDRDDATIALAILSLGQSLGLAVIAEGVETEPQRDFLADHGCHAYQGYLFSRPISSEQFIAFIRRVVDN